MKIQLPAQGGGQRGERAEIDARGVVGEFGHGQPQPREPRLAGALLEGSRGVVGILARQRRVLFLGEAWDRERVRGGRRLLQ